MSRKAVEIILEAIEVALLIGKTLLFEVFPMATLNKLVPIFKKSSVLPSRQGDFNRF